MQFLFFGNDAYSSPLLTIQVSDVDCKPYSKITTKVMSFQNFDIINSEIEKNLERIGVLLEYRGVLDFDIIRYKELYFEGKSADGGNFSETGLIDHFDKSENHGLIVDDDYLYSAERLQEAIDTTTELDSTTQSEITSTTHPSLIAFKVLLDHIDWGCNVFPKAKEDPPFDFNTPHILDLISAREKHESEVFIKFHRCACDESNRNCRFQTGIEFLSRLSHKVIERKLNKFHALFGNILAYDGKTQITILNDFPVWSTRATNQYDNQYSIEFQFFEWSCKTNGDLSVAEVQTKFDGTVLRRIFGEKSATVVVSSSCDTDGLIVIFDLDTDMTELRLKQLLDNRIQKVGLPFNYDGYLDYQILSKIIKETGADTLEPETITLKIKSISSENQSSTRKNFEKIQGVYFLKEIYKTHHLLIISSVTKNN